MDIAAASGSPAPWTPRANRSSSSRSRATASAIRTTRNSPCIAAETEARAGRDFERVCPMIVLRTYFEAPWLSKGSILAASTSERRAAPFMRVPTAASRGRDWPPIFPRSFASSPSKRVGDRCDRRDRSTAARALRTGVVRTEDRSLRAYSGRRSARSSETRARARTSSFR